MRPAGSTIIPGPEPALFDPACHRRQPLLGEVEGRRGVGGAEAGPVERAERQPEAQHADGEWVRPLLEQGHAPSADQVVLPTWIVLFGLVGPRPIDPEAPALAQPPIGWHGLKDQSVLREQRHSRDLGAGETSG